MENYCQCLPLGKKRSFKYSDTVPSAYITRTLNFMLYKRALHSFIKGVKRLSHASSPYRGKVFQQTDEPWDKQRPSIDRRSTFPWAIISSANQIFLSLKWDQIKVGIYFLKPKSNRLNILFNDPPASRTLCNTVSFCCESKVNMTASSQA